MSKFRRRIHHSTSTLIQNTQPFKTTHWQFRWFIFSRLLDNIRVKYDIELSLYLHGNWRLCYENSDDIRYWYWRSSRILYLGKISGFRYLIFRIMLMRQYSCEYANWSFYLCYGRHIIFCSIECDKNGANAQK